MAVIHAVYENGVFRPKEPIDLPESSEVEVELRRVTPAVEFPAAAQERGAAMAASLERLAAAGGSTSFGDAAEWEREARQERSFPGRDS